MKLLTGIEILNNIYQENGAYPEYMNSKIKPCSKKTFNILLDSFELGDKYASFAIAYCYHSGCDDFDINLDKAIYWYKINFEDSGHIAAGFELAKIYTCQKQYQKAFKIYTKLATINHHQALTALGFFYKNGLYVKKDLNKALKYYQKGYKYGNLAAPVGIAIIYRKQHKYIKSLLLIIKVIGLRVISLFKGTLDEDTRMI
jgi:TPR repeat protein